MGAESGGRLVEAGGSEERVWASGLVGWSVG